MISLMHVYGKLEELILFVQAVNRWKYADMNGLPNYINHGWNPEGYLQNVVRS